MTNNEKVPYENQEVNKTENTLNKKMETREQSEISREFIQSVEDSKLGIDDKINLLLTKGGLKPASVIELPLKLTTQEEIKEYFQEEDIQKIIELVKNSGLQYKIGEKKIVRGTYSTKEEPYVEKQSQGEEIDIFVASSPENLDLLAKSWGSQDHTTIGRALGFPPSAVEAYTGQRPALDIDEISPEMRQSEAVLFLTPTLSQDNWQEELAEGKRRAEFIKKISPRIYEAKMKMEERRQKWEKTRKEIEETADALGFRIDEGIKETVIALNVFGIRTDQSCEGHVDKGMGSPWISIEAPGRPEERFVGENAAFEKAARKYGLSLEQTKRMENIDAYREAIQECSRRGETPEFQKWKEESGRLLYIMKDILNDFYSQRNIPDELKIRTDTESMEDMAEGSFRIFNGGQDYRDIRELNLTAEEKRNLESRLKNYRKEMRAFAEFLEDKFFDEGENYVAKKMERAQAMLDQEKIRKIQEQFRAAGTEAYAKESLQDFESVEIKKLSDLPCWKKIKPFLNQKK